MLEYFSQEGMLFPTPIWRVKISGVNNKEIKDYCKKIQSKSPGVQRSNIGGWHSHPYEITKPYPDSFKELMNDTTEFVNGYCSQITGITNLILGNYWFNVNPKNTYNQVHDHAGCLLSAVYYVHAEGDDIGNLEIHRGDAGEFFINSCRADLEMVEKEFTGVNFITKPETGMMYIIPSWIKHSVGINRTDTDRISIAMNFGVKKSELSKDRIEEYYKK